MDTKQPAMPDQNWYPRPTSGWKSQWLKKNAAVWITGMLPASARSMDPSLLVQLVDQLERASFALIVRLEAEAHMVAVDPGLYRGL